MTKDEVLKNTLKKFPSVKKSYQAEIQKESLDKDSGLHTIFGFIFVPILIEAIKNNPKLATEMFDYIEELETSKDTYVAEVCEFTVLEEVCDEFTDKQINPYVGNETKLAIAEIRKYISGPKN